MQILNEIIVDNFAGGGGVSKGIEDATGKPVTIAINHNPAAIAMHKVNHPKTKHYIEDVWKVDPVEAAAGRPVGLAWFSPDCTHHSKARGGKPKDKNIRGLAWVAVKWALKVKPRVIILENVEEFQDWGPLTADNQPDPKRKGETFQLFVKALRRQGYKVEWRELRACDYGAPTIRKRFFLIARRDGKPIVWPKPTHANPKSQEVKEGKLKSWRTAAEIIDWSIPTKSIFKRKKPLADNTINRIAKGIDKFVINSPEPFIVTTEGNSLETPTLLANQFNNVGGSVEEPLKTILTGNHHYLVSPSLIQYHSETASSCVRGQSLKEPIMTLDSSPRYAVNVAFLSKYYGGFYEGAGSDLNEPISTITSKEHNALAAVNICVFRNNMDGKSLNEPLPTITAGAMHMAEQATFLTKYYGQGIGQGVNVPIDTIVSKDRFGFVSVKIEKVDKSNNLGHWNKVRDMLNKYCNYNLADDEVLLLFIKGIYYFISDVGLRMLVPRELFNGQGFPTDYIIDHDDQGKPYPQYAQVARCGNAVPPQFPKALVQANLPELCGLEYVEGLEQEPYYEQLSLFERGQIS
jgi:DNA (cytosine-5)-methyltransferase 1